MAATRERHLTDISSLDQESIQFVHDYTGIPLSDVPAHVLAVRTKALQLEYYACIASFRFLQSKIDNVPYSDLIMNRLKDGDTLCDAGCCFGTDLRILSFRHGVPSSQLYGFDLEKDFIEGGYDLFQDKNKWKGSMTTGNVLIDDPNLRALDGKMDIVTANSFLHVFDLPDMTKAAERLVPLTKGKGSVICGRQVGSPNARSSPIRIRDGNRYLHNPETMTKFWHDVGEATGTKWDVESGFFERRDREGREGRDDTLSIWWIATRTE